MKVYNKGVRPILYESSLRGNLVIHPRKYIETNEEHAESIIAMHADAVDEKTFHGAPDTPKRGRPSKEDE